MPRDSEEVRRGREGSQRRCVGEPITAAGDQGLNPARELCVTVEGTAGLTHLRAEEGGAHPHPPSASSLPAARPSWSPGELAGESPWVPAPWGSACPRGGDMGSARTVSTTVNKTHRTRPSWNLHGGWLDNTYNKKIIVC